MNNEQKYEQYCINNMVLKKPPAYSLLNRIIWEVYKIQLRIFGKLINTDDKICMRCKLYMDQQIPDIYNNKYHYYKCPKCDMEYKIPKKRITLRSNV